MEHQIRCDQLSANKAKIEMVNIAQLLEVRTISPLINVLVSIWSSHTPDEVLITLS